MEAVFGRYRRDLDRCEADLRGKRRRLIDELQNIDQEVADLRKEKARFEEFRLSASAAPAERNEEKPKISLQEYRAKQNGTDAARRVVVMTPKK